MLKKILCIVLALTIVFALAACGGTGSSSSSSSSPGSSSGTGSSGTGGGSSAGGSDASGRTEALTLRLGALGSGREDDIQRYPITAFIEYVEEHTDDMIQIEYFPDGQLGQESDMMDQVITDTLDIGVLSANVLGTVWPEMYAYNLPFAFSGYEQMWEAIGVNSEYVSTMTDIVDSSDLAKFVTSFSAEFRGCHNNARQLRAPADFQGVTFRVMSGQIFTDMFQALGASTATIAFAELYTALEQGTVQGEDLGASCTLTTAATRSAPTAPSSI